MNFVFFLVSYGFMVLYLTKNPTFVLAFFKFCRIFVSNIISVMHQLVEVDEPSGQSYCLGVIAAKPYKEQL